MSAQQPTLRDELCALSERLGKNPDLVQGAGGNVSWKDGDVLYVKASGTWLARAREQEIFVSLSLPAAVALARANDCSMDAAALGDRILRPSIETALHALLPQRIVLHLHPVDVIAQTAQRDYRDRLPRLLGDLSWAWIEYAKPGAKLAEAIQAVLHREKQAPSVWILANHGLVIAAESVAQTVELLGDVLNRLRLPRRQSIRPPDREALQRWHACGYELARDEAVHALALDPICQAVGRTNWVLYPDHAVFLGAACTFLRAEDEVPMPLASGPRPPVLVIQDCGVLIDRQASAACRAMLSCYVEVLLRLRSADGVVGLSESDVAELLNWEAEAFRQRMNQAAEDPDPNAPHSVTAA